MIFKRADEEINNRFDMGKKKITKEPKSAKGKAKEEEKDEPDVVPEPTSAKKKGKKNNKSSAEINIFS